jgi:exodeoxyribonuclease VII small subunit
MTFEQLVAALEQLTERMASGQIGIEEAAELYEEAERIHGLAAERLARVQARIEARKTDNRTGPAPDLTDRAGVPAGAPTDPPGRPTDPPGLPADSRPAR